VKRWIEYIREDIQTVFEKDPAARSVWEIVCCYPGLHALWMHRVAHWLWTHRLRFCARLLSHIARALTGIEIHPGARIGRRVFIDHGMGVVIGETAEVGDDVLMYQGVVLGGTSLEKKKRHPTLGNHVVVGAGATILGPITVGDHARVGAGSVVVKPVPAGATVVGVPARIAEPKAPAPAARDELEHGRLPDPVLRTLSETLDRQSRLEERLRELEETVAQLHPPVAAGLVHPLPPACEAGIRQALTEVIEPEVGENVVDLGLIREIVMNGQGVEVRMSLTYPGCPQASYLVEQVRRKVHSVTGEGPVEVVVVG
jgi:serine O-acetyltransferase